MSGSREIGLFPRVQFSFNRNFFTYCACAAFNGVLSVTEKKLRIDGFFASSPFLTYLCNERLKPSIQCVQLERKIIERSLLMALVFYYKDMLEKVTIQRTQQFSAFSLLPKEPS